jgi:hypothetical protein
MVPEEAVIQRADGSVVFRIDDQNRVERLLVETGVHEDGMIEISHGLDAGDLVVARGQTWLSDGDLVTPRHPDGTLATRRLPEVAGRAAKVADGTGKAAGGTESPERVP